MSDKAIEMDHRVSLLSRLNNRRLNDLAWRIGEAMIYFVALIVIWEVLVRVLNVPAYIFPSAIDVGRALYGGIASGLYLQHLQVTMTAVLIGFAIGSSCGLFLGVLITTFAIVNRVLYPYIIALQTMPKVAIAPLMIAWFGFGIHSKIVLVAIASMFPMLINTISGIRAADSDRVAMVRALGGSRWQILRYILLPNAVPFIFAGAKTGIVLSVISAIVGEFVGARYGIGVLILQANYSLDMARVFSLIVLLSLSGVVLSSIVMFLERRICFWAGKSTR